MKKVFLLLGIGLMSFAISCSKESPASSAANTSSGGGSTGGSGGGGNGGGGGQTPVPFGANFALSVSDPNNIFENQSITLINNASEVVSYLWKIDNNTKITEKSPTISFPSHGLHKITLTVTDARGNTATASKDINILCIFGGGNH